MMFRECSCPSETCYRTSRSPDVHPGYCAQSTNLFEKDYSWRSAAARVMDPTGFSDKNLGEISMTIEIWSSSPGPYNRTCAASDVGGYEL